MGLLMLFLFFSCNSATYQFLQMSLCYVISPELSVLFLKTTQLCWKLILPVCSLLEIREFSFYQNEGPLVLVKLLFWDQQQMCSLFIFLGTPVWPLILLITTSSIFSFYIYLILLFNMNMPLYFLFFFLLFYVTFRRREVLNLLFFFEIGRISCPLMHELALFTTTEEGKLRQSFSTTCFPCPSLLDLEWTTFSKQNNQLKWDEPVEFFPRIWTMTLWQAL